MSLAGVLQNAANACIDTLRELSATPEPFEKAAALLVDSLRSGGKLLTFGNGGSASDAQHIAAELVGRYLKERRALPALALTVNTSTLTAVANDYGYEQVFARQVAALATDKDVCIALSTSGNSPNVIQGILAARQRGAKVIGMTGRSGGKLRELCDVCLCVPSDQTPRIQEAHILLGHALCEVAETELSR